MKNNKILEKFNNTSVKNKKLITSASVMVLVVTATIALTLAYLAETSQTLVNEFEVPEVIVEIEEKFDYVTKENVTATNSEDSDVDVYVRLKFVVQTLEFVDSNENGEYDPGLDETGDIIATPSQYDDYGYLENLPITITNVLDVEGLNVDFSGEGNADWFTDATQSTGIYFYKYSLAPGESAYDLVAEVYQEVYYEGVIIRLTIIADSVQVDGVEYAWENVLQSETYTDANGNPVLYSATWSDENGATGVQPKYNRVAADTYTDEDSADGVNYVQRFATNYDATAGIDSYGNSLVVSSEDTDTTE